MDKKIKVGGGESLVLRELDDQPVRFHESSIPWYPNKVDFAVMMVHEELYKRLNNKISLSMFSFICTVTLESFYEFHILGSRVM